ncbi:tetratricopeptide repeat protein [Streptomyces sp. NPDC127077]|uniref:tetratricopeptide repeat protein n=1 Tax=Streptomyces sp. NPDC127077 TaxID=3347131 RepID=UPI0036659254
MLTWTKVAQAVFAGVRQDEDEHWRTHHGLGATEHVRDEQNSESPALTELRRLLSEGLARMRLGKAALAGRAQLGRTTVSEAFRAGGPIPSQRTVAALAQALQLSSGELLALQREADRGGVDRRSGPGRLISEWEPHDLEIHPAGHGTAVDGFDAPGTRFLPGYVRRDHDRVLDQAVKDVMAGRSRIVILVGTSSTGKTRACWEAVQPLAEEEWLLWHPFDPTPAAAALEGLRHVQPHTVVWLNEAQHYFDRPDSGERIAAALQTLLTTPERGPVLVLGTLWTEFDTRYTTLPSSQRPDPYSRTRELLSGRTLSIPETFDAQALAMAKALADEGDRLLTDALTRAESDGRLAQDLAGAPELLRRYERATPAARAVLEAAMDARRLGVGPYLPYAFLAGAASDYLTDTEYDQLPEDWVEQAFAELAKLVHGKQAPLRNATPRPRPRPSSPSIAADPPRPAAGGPMFRLADYLEQHGRTIRIPLCPPASFWDAASTHLTHPDDLDNLVVAAEDRHRLQWAQHLRYRAADHGSISALSFLARMQENAGDREGAESHYRRAIDLGATDVLFYLAVSREGAGDRNGADDLVRQAANCGNISVLHDLAEIREESGDHEGAEFLARLAADHGSTSVLFRLAMWREESGDQDSAEILYKRAADYASVDALYCLAVIQQERGDRDSAERFYRQADDHDDPDALCRVVPVREMVGDWKGAETLARRAADRGRPDALYRLAVMREEVRFRKDAENLYREAGDRGSTEAFYRLGRLREKAGDRKGAEAFFRKAVDHGRTEALTPLGGLLEQAGDAKGAKSLYRQAAAKGKPHGLVRVVMVRERTGDKEGAEMLARQLADDGNLGGIISLGRMREKAGEQESAENLYRQAADRGSSSALDFLAMLREQAGDPKDAENLARRAADLGSPDPLYRLGRLREKAGDRRGAESLYRQVADRGAARQIPPGISAIDRCWPDGLDADGQPTLPWQ